MPRILLVDDDAETCTFLEELLAAPDRQFVSVQDPDTALVKIHHDTFDLLISDINLNAPQLGHRSAAPVQRRTGQPGRADQRVRHAGNRDRGRPRRGVRLHQQAVRHRRHQAHRRSRPRAGDAHGATRRRRCRPAPPGSLIGRTAPMLEVYKQIAHAADSAAPVLIVGESGVGKELVARAIHDHSVARARAVRRPSTAARSPIRCSSRSCSGISAGAFTGAVADHKGVFEQAGKGTVLLDEIGDTTPALQVRLLRVLEEGEVRPVGGQPIAEGLAARHRRHQRAARAGGRRGSLPAGPVLPAERDRHSRAAAARAARRHPAADRQLSRGRRARAPGKKKVLSADALDALMRHAWPGNVRELRNTIERLVVSSRGSVIEALDLPDTVLAVRPRRPTSCRSPT